LGLKWEDVDLEAGTRQVRRTLVTTKDGPQLTAPKTKCSRRTVKAHPGTAPVTLATFTRGLVLLEFVPEKGYPLTLGKQGGKK
jgi:integrase